VTGSGSRMEEMVWKTGNGKGTGRVAPPKRRLCLTKDGATFITMLAEDEYRVRIVINCLLRLKSRRCPSIVLAICCEW